MVNRVYKPVLMGFFSALIVLLVASSATAAETDQVGFVEPNGRWHVNGTTFWFGAPGDIPLFGDWDCDGLDTPAVYRPTTGQVHLINEQATANAARSFWFGIPGDVPFAGDFNSDMCDSIGVYRSGEGKVYLRDSLDTGIASRPPIDVSEWANGTPFYLDDPFAAISPRHNVRFFHNGMILAPHHNGFDFGQPRDLVVAGDWRGRGIDGVGVVDPTSGDVIVADADGENPVAWTIDLPDGAIPIAGSTSRAEPGWTLVGEREIQVPATGDHVADGWSVNRAAGFIEFQDRSSDRPWTIGLDAGRYQACRRGTPYPEHVLIVGQGRDQTFIEACTQYSLNLRNSSLRDLAVNTEVPLGTGGNVSFENVDVRSSWTIEVTDGVLTASTSTIGFAGLGINNAGTVVLDRTVAWSGGYVISGGTVVMNDGAVICSLGPCIEAIEVETWNARINAGPGTALRVGAGPVVIEQSDIRGGTAAVVVQDGVISDVTIIDSIIEGPLLGEVITCLNVNQSFCPT
ncbi:MAG: hypothetical protein ACR2OI_01485 [Acidimicrobiia bacterium]